MFQCSTGQMFKCSNVKKFHSNNVQMFKFSNVPMFKCSNIKCNMSKSKCQMSIMLNFCRHILPEFLRSFFMMKFSQPNECGETNQADPIHLVKLAKLVILSACRDIVSKGWVKSKIRLWYMQQPDSKLPIIKPGKMYYLKVKEGLFGFVDDVKSHGMLTGHGSVFSPYCFFQSMTAPFFTCLKFRLQLNIAGFGKVKGISTGQCLCLCQAVALWGCRWQFGFNFQASQLGTGWIW